MISKVLVANRGEIAIRAFRAAYEMGIATVAVYPYEDRNSLHRLKADESYQIGEKGHPVRAYLSVDEIIRVAQHAGADAVYPGYGFLSENPDLAAACAAAGITFVGPGAEILELTGNKSRAIAAARAAGLPVLTSSAPSASVDELLAAAASMEFPLFVKAVSGGGGRGMRRVTDPAALPEAIEAASREAESAFGDPTVYLEQAVLNPRHIEVQILADTHGNVMHLFERDCSVQRRHQKVIELAPAPNLPDELRQKICADAVAFARQIDYTYAGTVEFLLDERGHHVFIEMNPRIQVEHTVTEEITDVDLVASQLRIADGETLDDLGLSQDSLQVRGAAMQCRITTEDPANGFRPDTGRITGYRSPGGAGIRLDGGSHLGAEISAHFDSMLVKLTCRGRDFSTAVARARRALAEFRIRGVSTNIPFLQAVVNDPDFRAGRVTTSFIDERPVSADRAHPGRPRHQDPQLPRRRHRQPAARPAAVDGVPAGQAARDRSRRGAAARQQAAADRAGAGGIRSLAARIQVGRCHRHDVPRRASVAAGHPGAHHRPADGRAVHGADDAAAAVDRVLGWRDLRCGASVPEGRPVGAAGGAARGGAQHLPADAAARPQHRRLHAVSGVGHARVRRRRRRRPASTSTASSTRSTTSTRCARRSTRCAKPARR